MRKCPCFLFLFFNNQGWSCLNCCGGGVVIRVSSQSPPQGGLDVVNSKGLPSLVQSDHIFHPSSLTRWLAVDNLFFFFIFRMVLAQTVTPLPSQYINPGLSWCLSGKESACQCKRPGFNPWVWKIS